jgi:bisphosphoglycerate-independent phosphoglycerate mutase (AlkP superfamily)
MLFLVPSVRIVQVHHWGIHCDKDHVLRQLCCMRSSQAVCARAPHQYLDTIPVDFSTYLIIRYTYE